MKVSDSVQPPSLADQLRGNPQKALKEKEVKKERAEKISKSLKGKRHSEEFKKKVSDGILNSPKHIAAIEKSAAKHRGKKVLQ